MQSWSLILGIVTVSGPILFAVLAYPESIAWSWNEGRGGYLFGLVFVVAELVGLKLAIARRRILAAVPMAAAAIAYLYALENGLREQITAAAGQFGVQLVYSWTWMWDFVVMAVFMVAALHVLFGSRWIRIAPAGPIFLSGTAIILSLDAFFPYDTLGPLQYVVPYLVQANVWLVEALDLGTAIGRDNLMLLRGDHGSMALRVFWPSAGVHSIIIFSLVIGAFMLKMNIPRGRKLAYFGIGIAGTIIVNMIRIFSLSWYALKVTANPVAWEEYHKIAGEIMFLPWLFAFILVVVLIESRRIKRMEGARQQAMSDNDAAATGGGDGDGVAGDDGTAAARSGVGDGDDDDDDAAATGGGDGDGVAGDDGTAAARSGVGDGGDDDDNNNARDIADTKDGASAAAGMELADPAQNSNGRKDA